jgi:tetratricopeptide (TPR) repeat protein
MAIRGYSAPDTERSFARARVLCELLPASPQLYPVVRGLISYYHLRAALDEGLEAGERLLRHADEHPEDVKLRVQAHYGHGATLFHMGRLAEARVHLEAALRDYDPASHREHVTVYGGFDPGVGCGVWLAWTLMLQGELDEASRHQAEALDLARRHGDEFTLAWTLTTTGITYQHFGEWETAERLCAEAAALAEEHGFPYPHGFALVWRGRALVKLGQAPLGIALVRQGIALIDATGARLTRPWYLAMLGEAETEEGDPSALRHFDEALAYLRETGEHMLEPIVLTGLGATLGSADPAEPRAASAEATLRQALAVAASQGNRLVGLRAAVALADHLRTQDRDPEGLSLLSAAYAPFADARIAAPEIVAARTLLGEAR